MSKGCFDSEVLSSDAFCDLSPAAKNLYFMMGVISDSYGVSSNLKSVCRTFNICPTNEVEGVINELVDSELIMSIADTQMFLITHYWLHNAGGVKYDRLKTSCYELFELFTVDFNARYTHKTGDWNKEFADISEFFAARRTENKEKRLGSIERWVRNEKARRDWLLNNGYSKPAPQTPVVNEDKPKSTEEYLARYGVK